MAFVRADVNGNGEIDLFDMITIAVIAKGNSKEIESLKLKLHVGMNK